MPIWKQIGQSPDFAEKLFDAHRASVPIGESRARVEVADQRNISHDATAGQEAAPPI
jgi:hypothetical protein